MVEQQASQPTQVLEQVVGQDGDGIAGQVQRGQLGQPAEAAGVEALQRRAGDGEGGQLGVGEGVVHHHLVAAEVRDAHRRQTGQRAEGAAVDLAAAVVAVGQADGGVGGGQGPWTDIGVHASGLGR